MDQALRQAIWDRAASRCEYCRMPQSGVDATFHVEHIIAKQHQGTDDESNLALACDRCNLFKGPNLSSVDSSTEDIVPLYHPRKNKWNEHFVMQGTLICGLTPQGLATVSLLQMNARRRRELREFLILLGEW